MASPHAPDRGRGPPVRCPADRAQCSCPPPRRTGTTSPGPDEATGEWEQVGAVRDAGSAEEDSAPCREQDLPCAPRPTAPEEPSGASLHERPSPEQDEDAMRERIDRAHHEGTQRLGKTRWYSHYELRVAKVERSYSGPEGR